ncbi:MAG: MFS transporter [Alphaproteobacteria bacterium]
MWRTGGIILGLAFLTLFVGGGGRHGIGLVLKPMAEALDWDRTVLGAIVAVFMLVTAVTMAVVGKLVDRFSPQWVLTGGFLISAIGIGGMTFAEAPWQALLLYGVIFAIGNGAVSITPVGVMLSRKFGKRAGFANAIAISGMGLGQLVILSGLSLVLVEAGWREVFIWLGLINLAAAPLLFVGLRRAGHATDTLSQPEVTGMSPRAAIRTRAFWLLIAVYGVCGFQDFFVSVHVVAFALDQGIAPLLAGNLLAFMGLAGLVGVLATGRWSDRSGPVWPTVACFIIRILIFALIATTKSPSAIAIFALAYGLTYWATAPLTVIFVRDIFGSKNLGLLTGLITMGHHAAGGLGALMGAAFFDTDGNYQSAFLLMFALSIVGSVFTLCIPRAR